ncbi:riboflavin biosynthesis protein RibC [Collibacillus ludicampi]|uniref:Riboflavin biosynthesis protein n=1 Tax=Collibacillus ludicampi TaxID=2771369 RepID=A0AAV4LJ16_9BACL|nr:bifunctional riboflavin kinase/FAD synthetase [Collibacillus ludicampi]GIM47846.1 riboflavin biosynthesis protein RibC [Collibacillus ludicampi]
MEVIRISGKPPMRSFEPSVMALGNFDGVHIGHQQIIKKAFDLAKTKELPLAVMTFDPHPRQVLGRGHTYDSLLTPLTEKVQLLKALGVDFVYVIEFNRMFAAISPEEFIREYVKGLNAVDVVVGFDYTFGAGGLADTRVLKELAASFQMDSYIVPPVNRDGEKVSSSLIREKLQLGDVKWAAELLGRPYFLAGHVVHGNKRGRLLGFPTANLEPIGSFVIPKNGVYLIRAVIDGEEDCLSGVMNIGYKPTFEGERVRTLEAHLFDFAREIYGKQLHIEFLDFLREERKFLSAEELIAQIRCDIAEAKERYMKYQL